MINKIRIPMLILLPLITLITTKCSSPLNKLADNFSGDPFNKKLDEKLDGKWEINNLEDIKKRLVEINKNQKGPKDKKYIKVMTLAEFSFNDKKMKLIFEFLGPDGTSGIKPPSSAAVPIIKKILLTANYQYKQDGKISFNYMDETTDKTYDYDKISTTKRENYELACDGKECPDSLAKEIEKKVLADYDEIKLHIREEGVKKIEVLLNELNINEYPVANEKGKPTSLYILKQVSN